LERLLMILKAKEAKMPDAPTPEVYLAPMGDKAIAACFDMAVRLRKGGVAVETDLVGRGLKAQMKYADKIGARYTIVVGDNELETGVAKLKDMTTGEQSDVALDDSLYTTLYNKALDRELAGMADLFASVVEEG
ncbi:MAG: histidine--tRNA ligase, partial [Clostridia bacterium]|nr:histidine--tRNA ligase [Clostridia bacterium]